MTQYGILVPPGHTETHRTVAWEGGHPELLELLLEVLNPPGIQPGMEVTAVSSRNPVTPGGLRMWRHPRRPDPADPGDWNDNALAVVRHLGHSRRHPIAGAVVFVGGDRGGDAPGLHPALLAWLDAALNALIGGGRSWPPLPDTDYLRAP